MSEIELHRDKKKQRGGRGKKNFLKFILKVIKANSYKLKFN